MDKNLFGHLREEQDLDDYLDISLFLSTDDQVSNRSTRPFPLFTKMRDNCCPFWVLSLFFGICTRRIVSCVLDLVPREHFPLTRDNCSRNTEFVLLIIPREFVLNRN